MSSINWSRWGGPLTILGGLLLVVFAIAANFIGESHWGFHALNAPPNALLALGIVGIYLYLRRQGNFGIVGKIGFYICAFVFSVEAIGGFGQILADGVFGAEGIEEALDIIHPLVPPQYRFRVVSYSSSHETSNLCMYAFGRGARTA